MLLAIDTGGTKTLVAGFNSDGSMREPIRFETPKDNHKYLDTLVNTIKTNYDLSEIEAIVIALPGIIDEGVALHCPNLGWHNFDIRNKLSAIFKPTKILVENDANLAGLAEIRSLGEIPANGLYITISTGIGTGIISYGKINQSLSKSEGGHMILEHDGIFRQWEDFASGRAIKLRYSKYAKDIHSNRAWYQITKDISSGLLAIIPVLQPDIIIIGGSIGTYFNRYSDTLNDYLNEKLPKIINRPIIKQAVHPEQAVLYGCYYHAVDSIDS